MRGLYAIVDLGALATANVDPMAFARAVLAARPTALQVRAKEVPAREVLGLLRALVPACRAAGVMLVANDRADVAALGGADAVHLGQDDLPIELARSLSPRLKIGLSTHTPEQLARALEQRPDYVAYGPVFATRSKENPDPVVGLEGLRVASALARAARTPLVAIGGIELANAPAVGALADAAAVIGALVHGGLDGVTRRALALGAALGGSGAEPAFAPAPA